MSDERAGFFKQTNIYLRRCMRGFMNDKGWKSFISVAIITVLVCAVTGPDLFVTVADTKNGTFALVSAGIWIGIFNSIRTICRERYIVQREHRTGLRLSSYVLAHWLYEAALCAADALIVTTIVRVANFDHFMEEGVFGAPTFELYISLFLITLSADTLGLLISAIVPDENTAMTVMPFALIVQLVMCGFIFELEGVTETISLLTISRWGLDAVCSSAHVNDMPEAYYGIVKSSSEMASDPGTLLLLWGILLVFAVVYAVGTVVALSIANR